MNPEAADLTANEIPERIPEVGMSLRKGYVLQYERDIPAITLSCGYFLQFPEQAGPVKPFKQTWYGTSKYRPHQGAQEMARRAKRMEKAA